MQIAGQHDRGGATTAIIREGSITGENLVDRLRIGRGIKKLETSGLIRKHGDCYFVARLMVPSLPRTPSGQLSFRCQDWDKLRQRLASL